MHVGERPDGPWLAHVMHPVDQFPALLARLQNSFVFFTVPSQTAMFLYGERASFDMTTSS